MAHYFVMVKPASSLCNMRCEYCFYHDVSAHRQVASHGVMTDETTEAVIANMFASMQHDDSITIAFQGGEPTLAGLPYFRHFVATVKQLQKKVTVSYALQTNGIGIDREWCAFLRDHRFLVGLSIDGYAKHHNAYRVDAHGKGTFGRVIDTKRLLDDMGVEYNVLCTLTNTLARHPQKTWQFILQEQIRYVQFTPCLNALETGQSKWGLMPHRFHSFYSALYPQWKRDVQRGRYVSVKLFDDLVNLLLRKEVTACGIHGTCQLQCVVEADGSVYPCDFYVLDPYCGGSLAKQTLTETRSKLEETGFLSMRTALPTACKACRYGRLCGGGCKRLASAMYVDETTGFCGFQHLLDGIGQDLCEMGSMLLRGSPI